MKSVEHKTEVLKFCHVSNFKLRPNGDSAHVKLTGTFQTLDLLYSNFILHA